VIIVNQDIILVTSGRANYVQRVNILHQMVQRIVLLVVAEKKQTLIQRDVYYVQQESFQTLDHVKLVLHLNTLHLQEHVDVIVAVQALRRSMELLVNPVQLELLHLMMVYAKIAP